MIIPNDAMHKRKQLKRTVVQSQNTYSDDSQDKSDSSDVEYIQELEEKINDEGSVICRQKKKGHKYAKISDQQRSALIDLVQTDHCTIKSAAKKLKINNSTAKAIMQVYKRDGRKQKKTRRDSQVRQQIENKVNNYQGHVSVIEINYNYIRSLENEKEQLTQQVIEKDQIIKSLTDQSLQLNNQITALNEQKLMQQNQLEQMQYYLGSVSYGQPLLLRNQYQFQFFR